MKILELKLKKDVLIVDAEGLEITQALIFNKFGNYNLSCYDFLCKGSELTEEIASELVHEGSYFNTFKNYITNDNHKSHQLNFAIKSFISAVESKEKFWLENPNSKTYFNPEEYIESEFLEFKEAEEKTFRNPLIFVKK